MDEKKGHAWLNTYTHVQCPASLAITMNLRNPTWTSPPYPSGTLCLSEDDAPWLLPIGSGHSTLNTW